MPSDGVKPIVQACPGRKPGRSPRAEIMNQRTADNCRYAANSQPERRRRDSGITMIETLMAAGILVIGSVGMLSLILGAIATNNRNKMDSTQTMLAESILEQITSTFGPSNGPGTSNLVDCAGNTWPINTTVSGSGNSGAPLSGANVDFSQSQLTGWSMNYVVSTPCSVSGKVQGTYDV